MWFWDSCRQAEKEKFLLSMICRTQLSLASWWLHRSVSQSRWLTQVIIGCASVPGSIKVYDSLFQSVGQIAILHSFHMLMQVGNSTPFINEKVQKQINTSDCSLVVLVFAICLCHGLDPVTEEYITSKTCVHLTSDAWIEEKCSLSQKHQSRSLTMSLKTLQLWWSSVFAEYQMTIRSMCGVFSVMVGDTSNLCEHSWLGDQQKQEMEVCHPQGGEGWKISFALVSFKIYQHLIPRQNPVISPLH